MNISIKLLRGDIYRKTRAHSEKGVLGVAGAADLLDATRSFSSHLVRVTTGRLPRLPWLTYGAIRYLERNLSANTRVFEFGGGMSTFWYEDRFLEVHTVEDNPEWCAKLKSQVRRARVYDHSGESFVTSISAFPPDYFDLVVVDGNFDREICFHRAEPHLKVGGLFVVDDSDKGQLMGGPIRQLDRWLEQCNRYSVKRFTGWIPGCFWVKETTIAQRLI